MAEAITSIGGGWRVFGSPRLALQLYTRVDTDGRNSANQLRLVVYPLVALLYTSQVVVWDVFHQQYVSMYTT